MSLFDIFDRGQWIVSAEGKASVGDGLKLVQHRLRHVVEKSAPAFELLFGPLAMLGPKMLSQSALLFNCFVVFGDVVVQLLLGLFVRANSFGFFLQESFVSTEKYIDNCT